MTSSSGRAERDVLHGYFSGVHEFHGIWIGSSSEAQGGSEETAIWVLCSWPSPLLLEALEAYLRDYPGSKVILHPIFQPSVDRLYADFEWIAQNNSRTHGV